MIVASMTKSTKTVVPHGGPAGVKHGCPDFARFRTQTDETCDTGIYRLGTYARRVGVSARNSQALLQGCHERRVAPTRL